MSALNASAEARGEILIPQSGRQRVFIKYVFPAPLLFFLLLPAATNCGDLIDPNVIVSCVDLETCQGIAVTPNKTTLSF